MPLKHLFRLLTLFALLIAPLNMLGDKAEAMAATPKAEAMASGHCAGMSELHEKSPDKQFPSRSVECMLDCMMLCSGMPTMSPRLAEPVAPPPMAMPAFVPTLDQGLSPQAEPRPPQFS